MDFESSVAEFSLPHDIYSVSREGMVLSMVRWLLNAGVVNIMDTGCRMRGDVLAFHHTEDDRESVANF